MLRSYAQNFEDVILYRALKTVQNGFYIDIGAQDPVCDSVSLAFYERGWRGVHIEPNREYAEKLRLARPDETVLECAVGARTGAIQFFDTPGTGLSTANEEIARANVDRGFPFKARQVLAIKTSDLMEQYKDRDVHWLKIDVEGLEKDVIEGWLPSGVRPWIVVVEATKPCTPEPSHADWEPQLISLGYDFVYFDGLNRFYVSHAHPELKTYFGPGPNVFDGFYRVDANTAHVLHALEQENIRLARCLDAPHAAAGIAGKADAKYPRSIRAAGAYITRRLLFRTRGKPRYLVRRILFHNKGNVRRLFRRVVFKSKGTIRSAFSHSPWVRYAVARPQTSPGYESLVSADSSFLRQDRLASAAGLVHAALAARE